MKKNYFCLFSLLLLVWFSICDAVTKEKVNYVTKIYYHQGTISDNLVCYFKQEPICNRLPSKSEPGAQKQHEIITYFLPMTLVHDKEVKSMLKKLQGAQKNGYSISFQEVNNPIKGIKVVIFLDSNKVTCEYKHFDAITGDKGLVFSFHNKDVLNKLKITTDPLIQYAINLHNHERPKIMLDFGHGGLDKGTVCFDIQEKNINFQVGTKVATLLEKAGYEVFFTRKDDSFVALDERTALTNKKKVDLFLSIHANSGPHKDSCGIETYWLDSSLFKNPTASCDAQLSQLNTIRNSLNCLLAHSVHTSTLKAAQSMYKVSDRKVKTSVAQVLLGTDFLIPAALIEIGFLSHQQERTFLINSAYQMVLAQGIAEGIKNYFKKFSML